MNTLKLKVLALALGLIGVANATAQAAKVSLRRVAGPVAVDSRRSTLTSIGYLSPGRLYLIKVQGRFSYWRRGGLCDAAHIIQKEFGGGFQQFPTLKFNNPNLTMMELATRYKKTTAIYNASNTYYALVHGSGLTLRAKVQDQPGMYLDNRGSLFVTVYEYVTTTARPRPRRVPPLTDVSTNRSPVIMKLWDHGTQDGDIVQIYINGRYYKTVHLTRAGTTLRLPLRFGKHRFQVKAMNTGRVGPNTASMSINGVTFGKSSQRWSLKTGQVAGMYINVHR